MSNFIQLIEVYEGSSAVFSKRIVGEKTTSTSIERNYTLRKIICNTEHISLLKENTVMREKFEKDRNRFPENLDGRQDFTTIHIGSSKLGVSSSITVVGSLEVILGKLNGKN